jgi:diguanylate cyclase
MSKPERILAYVWLAAALLIVPLSLAGVEADLRSSYSNAVQLLAAYLATLFCFRTSGASPVGSATRQVWFLMGAGILAWALGQSYFWLYGVLSGQETPYPSLADIGFLMIGPLFVVALMRFRFDAGLAAPLWAMLASPLVLLAATALATYINLAGIQSEDATLRLVSIAYSVSDPLLLSVTLLVASGFGRGSIARSWWYVVLGIGCFFFANQAYSTLVFHEMYASGSAFDALWPLGFGLIALGAVRARAAQAAGW